MAIWKLTIEDDEGQKTVVPLVRDEYTVGRREGHAIRLTERNVSRDHARLKKDDGGYVLEDLGSYNGVFVNGHRVAEPQKVQAGDLVLIGDFRIEAHNDEAAPKLPIAVSTAAKPSSPPPAVTRPAPQSEPSDRLVLLTGEDGGKEFALDKPRLIIGRGDDVDIRVNHSSVSRHHCELHVAGNVCEVMDQASANGIRVNGRDVKKARLSSGDTIELGDVRLRFVPAGQAFVFDAAAEAVAAAAATKGGKKGVGIAVVIGVVLVAGIGGVIVAKSGGSPTVATTGGGRSSDDDGTKAPKSKDAGPATTTTIEPTDVATGSTGPAPSPTPPGTLDPPPTATKPGPTTFPTPPTTKPTAFVPPVPTPTTTKSTAPPPATTTAPPPPASTTAKPASTGGGTPGDCPSWKGDYSAAMRAKDYDCVRKILMPRLNGGSISAPEARYLKAACGALGDTECAKRAAAKI